MSDPWASIIILFLRDVATWRKGGEWSVKAEAIIWPFQSFRPPRPIHGSAYSIQAIALSWSAQLRLIGREEVAEWESLNSIVWVTSMNPQPQDPGKPSSFRRSHRDPSNLAPVLPLAPSNGGPDARSRWRTLGVKLVQEILERNYGHKDLPCNVTVGWVLAGRAWIFVQASIVRDDWSRLQEPKNLCWYHPFRQ